MKILEDWSNPYYVIRRVLITLLLAILPLVTNAAGLAACQITPTLYSLLGATQNLNPQTLKYGLEAYNCAVQQAIGNKPLLTIIDYTLPSTAKRLWVIDMVHKRILFNTLVAQGKFSGDLLAHNFSNRPESRESSLGLFVTESPYIGHNGYSLRIKGLEQGFNDKAEEREIVIHGAWYVSDRFAKQMGRLGLSWGCPAVSKTVAKPLIDTIKDGSLLFAYYPTPQYLAESKFLHCSKKSAVKIQQPSFFHSFFKHLFSRNSN